jgi:endonuclease G
VRKALYLAALALFATGIARADFDPAAQMLLGNPSGAVADAKYETNYLISRNEYALGYSRYDGICKWVAWHLNASDVGSSGRGTYTTDTSLPAGWYQVTPDSGWSTEAAPYGPLDRGHMCPSGDRTATTTANDDVFLMTNLVPQASDNNQGPWENFESYCRTLAQSQGDELYIICGPRGFAKGQRITSGNVTLPAYVWKIAVVLPDQSGDDLARVNASTRVIAIDMPNIAGIKSADWHSYRVSVAAIEAGTGLHFFSSLPVAVRNALINKVDTAQ